MGLSLSFQLEGSYGIRILFKLKNAWCELLCWNSLTSRLSSFSSTLLSVIPDSSEPLLLEDESNCYMTFTSSSSSSGITFNSSPEALGCTSYSDFLPSVCWFPSVLDFKGTKVIVEIRLPWLTNFFVFIERVFQSIEALINWQLPLWKFKRQCAKIGILFFTLCYNLVRLLILVYLFKVAYNARNLLARWPVKRFQVKGFITALLYTWILLGNFIEIRFL